MANHTNKRGHRPRKDAISTRLNLSDRHRQIASAIAPTMTAGIETALELIEVAIDAAAKGDEKAIALLSKLGVEVQLDELKAIEVKRSDGSIAAWII
jgi:hypothetical protein